MENHDFAKKRHLMGVGRLHPVEKKGIIQKEKTTRPGTQEKL